MLVGRRLPRAAAFVVGVATLATVGSGITALSANAVTDSTPPTLVSYSLVNNTVDVTDAPGGIGVTLNTTDDQSGFSSASVAAHCTTNCGSQTSLQSSDVSFTSGPVTAQQANVVVHVPITIPDQSVWAVDQVTVTDDSSNSRTYSATDTPLPNAAPTFTVTRTPDVSNPVAGSLAYQGTTDDNGTPTVDVTTADKTVNASVHLSDTGTGIDENSIVLTLTGPDPGNGDPAPTKVIDSFNRTKGSVHTGDFLGFFDAANFGIGDDGTWTASLHVADFQGNAIDVGDASWNIVVTSTPDSQGPQLATDPSLGSPSALAGDSVSLTSNITDDVTGFAYGFGSFTEEAGIGDSFGFDINTSDLTTGNNYVSTVEVPYGVEPGTYDLSYLSLTDRQGHSTNYDGIDNPVPSLTLTVTAVPTEEAPTLASIQVRPGTLSVDDTYGSDRADVAYLAIDDNGASGFEQGRVTVQAPDASTGTVDFDASNRVSGDAHSGVYRVFVSPTAIGGYPTQDGSYTITNVDLWSHAQRFAGTPTTSLDATALGALSNSNLSFTVNHDGGDDAAPVIDSVELSPAHINTETGAQQVTATVHAHDTGGSGATSGISAISVGLKAANSNQTVGSDTYGGYYDNSLQSGDDTDGTYVFTIDVPQWSTPGTWTLNSAYIYDNSPNSNYREYGVITIDSDPNLNDINNIGGASHTVVNDAAVGDTTAPAVKNITVDASPVDASDGASYRLTGTIELTDDLSGVDSAEVDLNGPHFQFASGYTTSVDNGPGAPQLDRTFTWSADIPAQAASGPWTFEVYPYDNAGNSTDIPAGSFPVGVTQSVQINGIPDSQAPTLASNGFAIGSTIDVTSGPGDDVATFHVLDDASGVADFSGNYSAYPTGAVHMVIGRQGSTSDDRDFYADVLGGTPRDAYLAARVHFNQYGDGGTWVVKSIQLTDAAGNEGGLIDESSNTITVTGLDDSTPPALNSIALTLVGGDTNLNDGPAHIAVSADITDDLSGVQSASFSLNGPTNADGGYADLQLNNATGKWEGTATIPQYSGVGTWTPANLWVSDNANNFHDYTNSALTAAGATPSFTFTGTQDTNPPALASFSFNPSSMTLAGAPQNTVMSLHITDDISGFTDGYVQLSSPNGLQSTEADFSPTQRISGDAKDGIYHVNVQIPSNAQQGTWTVSNVWLQDVANNFVNLTGGLLPTGTDTAVAVTNPNAPTFDGVVNGQVTGPTSATPLSGAWVSICNTQGYGCASASTDGGGDYSVSGLPDGVYSVNVSAPSGTTFNAAEQTLASSLYTFPSKTATENFTLTQPAPLPSGATVNGTSAGVPRVFYGSPITLTATNCASGTGTYTITMEDGTVLTPDGNGHSGALSESPTGSGNYTASIPAPYPSHGTATVQMEFTCPGVGTPVDETFTLYIDPSGFVKDTGGTGIAGATVTLFRSDSAGGTFTQVPDGDATMSPSNRRNPDTSDGTGHYGWDVTAGFYKVTAAKSDCYQAGSYVAATNSVTATYTSPVQQIPPAVTDLTLTLDCTNIAPVASFTQSTSGAVTAGTSVHFDAGASKDANGSLTAYNWNFGDGTTGSGATADHVYSTSGTFTPRLTVIDDGGNGQPMLSTSKNGAALTVTAPVQPGNPTVTITSAPASLTNQTSGSVSFTTAKDAAVTITSVTCAVDNGTASACTSPFTFSGLGAGAHKVVVTATDSASHQGSATAQWTTDTTAPTSGMLKPASTTTLGKSVGVAWGGADANGVASYDVRYQVASWRGKLSSPVPWKTATTATSAAFNALLGYEYCLSVRTHDAAGNVSGWSASKCTAVPLDDRALSASAGWKKLTGKSFFNGTARQAAAKGKTLTIKGAAAGRAVLVVDKGKGFGAVNVLYNGKVVKKISLAATRTQAKVLITLPKVTKTTTIVIKTLSAAKVQIDGLLLARI